MTRAWYLRVDTWLPIGLVVAALGVYAATLNPTIDYWDCGEFVTVSHIMGVPHQPGTPLYVVVGRFFVMLFGQPDITQPSFTSAWAVNFMSATFSALAVMLIYLIIVRVARRADPDSPWLARVGGVVGALFLLFSDTFWVSAIEAEVYGLAAFTMALLTWIALVWYDHRTERSSDWLLLLLLYLCGLGVGFHLGSLLVFPAFFLLVWLSTDRQLPLLDLMLVSAGLALFLASTTFITDTGVLAFLTSLFAAGCVLRLLWPRLRPSGAVGPSLRPFALVGFALFVIGLSVHAVLMIRAGAVPEPAINQTVPKDFDTLMSVLRREQYPPINPLVRQAPLTFQFQYYYDFLLRQFSFLPHPSPGLDRISVLVGPLLLAALGAFHALRRVTLLAVFLLVCYQINAEGLTLYLNFTANEVRERDYFYFAAFMYATVFIGLGTTALLRWTSGPLGVTLGRLEQAVLPPPASRPFSASGAFLHVVAAFAAALVLLVLTPAAVQDRWLGLFLFGSLFVGLLVGRRIGRLTDGPAGRDAPPAWTERPLASRLLIGGGLAFGVVVAAWLLLQFAAPQDEVFVVGVFAMLWGGQFLCYGERRRQPLPAPIAAPPAPARVDALSWVAAGALVILAALPAIGALGPGAHDKWFRHDRSENRIAHENAYNILAGLDPDAIVFTNGDNDTFPIWYLQEVERIRRDVTVVNLSLVNLPWYVKQLKRLEKPVALSYSDQEIDELRPVAYRDRDTGEVVYVYVRDYVVKDIIDTNMKKAQPRPIYFAVTIPQENMERYYPFLLMEGLAYRLTTTRHPEDLPGTDPERLLANVFGAYRLDALTSGDTAARQQAFAAMAGVSADQPVTTFLAELRQPPQVDYLALLDLVGHNRTDVYRDPNTANLLGNYPASVARAGFAFLAQAEDLRLPDGGIASADTLMYDYLTDRALICYELAMRFDPYNGLVAAGYYPYLLLERGRTDDAFAYLERIHGRMPEELERSAILSTLRGLMTLDMVGEARGWLERRIAAMPDWLYGYELLFRLYEGTGEVGQAAQVVDRWREANGADDPGLRFLLQQLRDNAQRQERERLDSLLREQGQQPEGR